GLPLLFDSQPRPVAIDTPIVIPDRNQAAPLATPGHNTKSIQAKESPALATSVPEQPTVTPAKSAVANVAALDPHEEVVTKDTKTEAKAEAKVETKVETKPDAKLEAKTDTKSEAKPESKESAKAKALLDGKDAPKSSDAVRSVVQVGAFADAAKAKEARTKLEQAGLKTYTQEVETKEGKRIRVRVGPFATKEEADKAAEKIRKLNLPTSVLKL
ncbi:MAG: SPOR domain-containing protein, partial [Betaproteobacteria bacterium]|nr:SPOR domain-containing protein [Betaproteobacteria bacterium]